jgi:LDH2 family malate/lactate/ureidoglycolate dehydrogenase
MATLIEGAGDHRVDAVALESFVADLFRAAGTSEDDARLIAGIAVGTDLRGAYSHGCALVPGYLSSMLAGRIDPAGRPSVSRDSGAALVVDGGNSLGHVGLTFAMDCALERAEQTGVAAVAVGGSNHCGAMASYALQAQGRDAIALATTNGLPTMGWFGGLDRILSINPVGIFIPAGEERPVVVDTSFGAAARGKILVHKQKGLPLPEGWAYDAEGNPTVDPALALDGLIQPAGGYKGASLALLMGVLSALLSGAAYGTELGDFVSGATPGRDGQFALAIHVGAFEEPSRFRSRMDTIIRQIKASRPAPGVASVHLPGEQAEATAERYRAEGVPVSAATTTALVEIAHKVGVDPSPMDVRT